MPSRLSLLALGGGAYLAFALANFPASTAVHWFAPPELALAGVSGTLWQGSAASASVPGLSLRNVRWRVATLPLLIGRLDGEFDARLPDGFVNGRASASTSRVRLTELQLSTSLQSLKDLLPLASTRGLLSAEIDELELEDGLPVSALGEVSVAELEVAPFVPSGDQSLIPLGDFVMTFLPPSEPGILASIRDTGGPLSVDGSFTLAPDSAYRFEGAIGTRAGASPMLVDGLSVMENIGYITGEPDAEGRRQFVFPGRLY